MNRTNFFFDSTPRQVPNLCLIECASSRNRPACRRPLQRRADESGDALWHRINAEMDALSDEHKPHAVLGRLTFLDCSLAEFERTHGVTAAHNHRHALQWLMDDDKCGDVRLWAATKLAQELGMLPTERVK